MEQLGLDGMPARLFSCTPARLRTYSDCPRRYRHTYLDRPAPPKGAPWAHNSLGASVHNALRGWWHLPLRRRTPASAGMLLDRGWLHDGWRDDAQSRRWQSRAQQMVEGYTATLDPTDEPLAVERQVGARTGTLALSGRVDRLDLRAGELVVVDYKTGRHPPEAADARSSAALALYAVAAARMLRRPCRRVELHHLPSGRVVGADHDGPSLDRQVRRAEDVAADILAGSAALAAGTSPDEAFPALPSRSCGWCDYRRHCPPGQAASAPRRPWDGLAQEEAGASPATAGPEPVVASTAGSRGPG